MQTVTLGRSGPAVGALGLGCMGMSPGAYGPSDEAESIATIRAAIIAAIKDAGYLHVPEGRRDHTTPAETLHLHGLY